MELIKIIFFSFGSFFGIASLYILFQWIKLRFSGPGFLNLFAISQLIKLGVDVNQVTPTSSFELLVSILERANPLTIGLTASRWEGLGHSVIWAFLPF